MKYMDSLITQFGESMPDSTVCEEKSRRLPDSDPDKIVRPLIFLHCGLFGSKTAVYKDFVDFSIMVEDSVSLRTFKRWWKKEFWNVKVS